METMTRLRRFALLFTVAFLLVYVVGRFAMAAYAKQTLGENSVPCTPAPATFATWTVCNTATARALTPRVGVQTQTPAPTRTPAPAVTPTRIMYQQMWCKLGSVTREPHGENETVGCQAP